jgi:hypothetical protein
LEEHSSRKPTGKREEAAKDHGRLEESAAGWRWISASDGENAFLILHDQILDRANRLQGLAGSLVVNPQRHGTGHGIVDVHTHSRLPGENAKYQSDFIPLKIARPR